MDGSQTVRHSLATSSFLEVPFALEQELAVVDTILFAEPDFNEPWTPLFSRNPPQLLRKASADSINSSSSTTLTRRRNFISLEEAGQSKALEWENDFHRTGEQLSSALGIRKSFGEAVGTKGIS